MISEIRRILELEDAAETQASFYLVSTEDNGLETTSPG